MSNYKLLQTMSNKCNTSKNSVYKDVAENDKSNDENDENNGKKNKINNEEHNIVERAIIVGNDISKNENYGIDHKGKKVKEYFKK